MFIKLWHGYCKTQFKSINVKGGEYNGKSMGMWNGRYRNFLRFSSNEFLKNLGCLVSNPTFGIGGSKIW